MSIEDTIGYQFDNEACAVCGKNVAGGGGFARVNHRGVLVNLCCPHCMETFEKDPEPHLARLAKAREYRALRELTGLGASDDPGKGNRPGTPG